MSSLVLEKTTDRMTGNRGLAKRILALALGLSFGLLLAEISVRAFTWIPTQTGQRIASRDPMGTVYEPYGNFGYRPRPGKIDRFSNGTYTRYNKMGFRGPVVGVPKAAGTFRIVLLGGSTAAGYGTFDDQTIDAHLRRLLAAQFPRACFEVINFGVGGYDSYQDYERMRVDGSRLSPDLVIIHSGINDVRNAQYADLTAPPDRRTLIWESALEELRTHSSRGPGPWTLLKHYSFLARLPGYVMELRGQRVFLAVTKVAEVHDAALDYFATNVERTVDVAAQIGAVVILSTPPSALSIRNKPTDRLEKSYWIRDAGTTEEYRRRLGARMEEIAKRERNAGRAVSHVSHILPLDQYLDDAHLLSPGNQTVAKNLMDAIVPYLRDSLPRMAPANGGCEHP